MVKHCLFIRQTLIAFIGLVGVRRVVGVPYAEADDKHERGRMEDSWMSSLRTLRSIFATQTQRIRQSDHLGDMVAAIASVPYQLSDSHTVFIPPGRSAKADYGFEAEPFATDILVYKLRKDGPAIG
jgi:hypothetical protein